MSAKQIISAQKAHDDAVRSSIDHYINFMEAEYYRMVHNYTHLPSFAAHNADALNKDGCFSPSESHIFHTTGVREPDIRRRSWLDAAFCKIKIQTKRKYFTRQIKFYVLWHARSIPSFRLQNQHHWYSAAGGFAHQKHSTAGYQYRAARPSTL